MPRLIDADALRHRLLCQPPRNISINLALELVSTMPTVNAEPAKRGRWIKVEDDYNNHLYECSFCHTWTSLPTEEVNDPHIRYCWSCGAKMGR